MLRREIAAAFKHKPGPGRRELVVLLSVPVLMTISYYWGTTAFYRRSLSGWFGLQGEAAQLAPYAWWGLSSLLWRVLVPCLLIVGILRSKPEHFGFKLSSQHAKIYLLLFLGMLPLLYLASQRSGFASTYPFYGGARRSWQLFVLYELCYLPQFVGVEAFFRGYLTFGLYPRYGYASLLIMAGPYCAIHFGKPPLETFGSILAGIALGFLALRSRSWYLGALLHIAVAATMDFLAIWNNGGFGA